MAKWCFLFCFVFLEKKNDVFVKGFEVSDEKYRESSWIYFKSLLVH